MASILTNTSAIAALQVLRDTSADLTKTQRQISSGLRIANSSDNAAYWSIATAMRSENKVNHTVTDAIALGRAIVDVAYTGMEQVLEMLDTTKSHLVLAKGMPGLAAGALFNAFENSALGKIDAEITQLALSAWSVAKSSGFNGVNLLVNEYDTDKSGYVDPRFIVGYTPENGLIHVDVDLEKTTLFNANFPNFATPAYGLLDMGMGYKNNASMIGGHYGVGFPTMVYAAGNAKPSDNYGFIFSMEYAGVNSGVFDRDYAYESAISILDDTIQQLTDNMAYLGALSSSLQSQDELNQERIDVLTSGVGLLVDADMNESSTRLKALQTQQQLGVQALSIANSNASSIVSLFQ